MRQAILALFVALLVYKFLPAEHDKFSSGVMLSKEQAYHPIQPVFFTILPDGPGIYQLQNFIGGLHRFSTSQDTLSLIHVFGCNRTREELLVIYQMRGVIYHDINHCFPDLRITSVGKTTGLRVEGKSKTCFEDGRLREAIMKRLLADHKNIVFIDLRAHFGTLQSESFAEQLSKHRHFLVKFDQQIVMEAAHDLTSLGEDPTVVNDIEVSLHTGKARLSCQVLQRLDFSQIHELQAFSLKIDKRSIVLGVPTTSKKTLKLDHHPLFQILLPSLRESAAKNPDFKFCLLVVYDEGDKFFDSSENKGAILDRIGPSSGNLSIYMIRSPALGSITMLWNLLYDMAMKAGAKYFYQLNDDVTFHHHNWPAVFTKWIDDNKGFGLTGPCDIQFPDCSLMTQNFVGRGHYEIFGFLFPPELRNWWCDDWINGLYERLGRRRCVSEISITNGGRKDGGHPRYLACPYLPSHDLMLDAHVKIAEAFLDRV